MPRVTFNRKYLFRQTPVMMRSYQPGVEYLVSQACAARAAEEGAIASAPAKAAAAPTDDRSGSGRGAGGGDRSPIAKGGAGKQGSGL
jgi:hypothetical protein